MNKALAAIGVAKQVDKATGATDPTFYHGVDGGVMVAPEITTQTVEITTGLSGPAFAYRESAATVVDFGTVAFKKAIGLYLLGILGNVETSGASAPFTHVFTAGASLPWLTFFMKMDAEYRKATGCKIDEIKVEWDGAKPLKVSVTGAGLGVARVATIAVPTADERLGSFFMPTGGTYKIDIDGAVPTEYPVLKASITLKRNLEADYSCVSIEPSDVNEGTLTAEVELTARVPNLDDFWTIIYGSPASNVISEIPVYGSFEIGSVDGADALTFAASRVPFTADSQTADPKGGPAELTLKGELMIAAGKTSQITATLVNDVATY